jgi:hypothetical protein
MNQSYRIHRIICFLANLLIIAWICWIVISTNSDKSIIVFMVFYPALFIVNLIVCIVLSLSKSVHAKIYQQALQVLLVLVLPLIGLLVYMQ